jgi:uncharacterized protein with HEPN domain
LSRGDDLRVADIVEAAEQLGELVTDGRGAFDADWTRQRAAERLLEIIGEAANALSEEHREKYSSVPWRHIINLRHLIAHHYHRVDMDQLWTIASVNIPEVLAALAPK